MLPNSQAEASQLSRLFGVRADRLHVIPNGVELRFAQADASIFRSRTGIFEPFVLYVGRVEPRKNVLGLTRAARALGLPLVVIGDTVPGHSRYGDQCRSEGGDLLRWLPRLEHADPLLASAYAAARVFALPSYFETPGLAALEAALTGCPLVITPHGCTREYFGELPHYARPGHPQEITRDSFPGLGGRSHPCARPSTWRRITSGSKWLVRRRRPMIGSSPEPAPVPVRSGNTATASCGGGSWCA